MKYGKYLKWILETLFTFLTVKIDIAKLLVIFGRHISIKSKESSYLEIYATPLEDSKLHLFGLWFGEIYGNLLKIGIYEFNFELLTFYFDTRKWIQLCVEK